MGNFKVLELEIEARDNTWAVTVKAKRRRQRPLVLRREAGQPGESVSAVIDRALKTLSAQDVAGEGVRG